MHKAIDFHKEKLNFTKKKKNTHFTGTLEHILLKLFSLSVRKCT